MMEEITERLGAANIREMEYPELTWNSEPQTLIDSIKLVLQDKMLLWK